MKKVALLFVSAKPIAEVLDIFSDHQADGMIQIEHDPARIVGQRFDLVLFGKSAPARGWFTGTRMAGFVPSRTVTVIPKICSVLDAVVAIHLMLCNPEIKGHELTKLWPTGPGSRKARARLIPWD